MTWCSGGHVFGEKCSSVRHTNKKKSDVVVVGAAADAAKVAKNYRHLIRCQIFLQGDDTVNTKLRKTQHKKNRS